MTADIYVGDVRDGLRQFIAQGVRAQTCVTSPPYYGLRDYGVTGQIGREASIAEWLAVLVDVFRLVRDVLADDGTLWVNMGDGYNAGSASKRAAPRTNVDVGAWNDAEVDGGARLHEPSLKRKDLIGQPWRLAFALQADGWYLRRDVIWHKPNAMPETVYDRPTTAHEYLFLLSKRERYFYDAEAIKEPATGGSHPRVAGWASGPGSHTAIAHTRTVGVGSKLRAPKGAPNKPRPKFSASFDAAGVTVPVDARNKRSVWTIPTEAFPDAHFATFPMALVEPCVLAGSRPGDIVLDPFMGSGTVAQVAQSLGRGWIGCELNPEYASMVQRRASQYGLALA